ncbi:hypothetical protein HDV00_006895 [Rhizophlyctis rosea]|nr:hypothetical protein HDV00_006895 [Rhizophlyctis rosea]
MFADVLDLYTAQSALEASEPSVDWKKIQQNGACKATVQKAADFVRRVEILVEWLTPEDEREEVSRYLWGTEKLESGLKLRLQRAREVGMCDEAIVEGTELLRRMQILVERLKVQDDETGGSG